MVAVLETNFTVEELTYLAGLEHRECSTQEEGFAYLDRVWVVRGREEAGSHPHRFCDVGATRHDGWIYYHHGDFLAKVPATHDGMRHDPEEAVALQDWLDSCHMNAGLTA